MTQMSVPIRLGAVGAAAVAALAAGSLPALAAPGTAGPAGRQSVTLVLAPRDAAGLAAMAARAMPGRRQDVAAVLATPAQRADVASVLRAEGLTVTGTGPGTVTAAGPPAVLARLFGTAVDPTARYARALPRVPAALRGLATAAFGASDSRPVAAPLAAPVTPAQLQQAYATVLPGAPLRSQTVATVQMSGWNDGDFATFAAAHGLADPVGDGQYAAVPVDGASPGLPDGNGGEYEVALDQETLLGVAPRLHQRAYFTPNSAGGYVDALYRVAQDAAAYHIVALSTSWGACEQPGDSSYYSAMETALSAVTAAGVTVFAASGDHGANDCGNGTASVDYPASSPEVVGVGGTTLTPGDSPGERVWNSGDGYAGGGGVSTLFGRPSWQGAAAAAVPGSGRVVPDISSDADPASGLDVFVDGGWAQVGGTSLGAPTQAGLLADTLVAGADPAAGDLHQLLYSAPATAFRDVTSGDNSVPYGATTVTGFAAGPGFDAVTGLGSPLWATLLDPVTVPGTLAAAAGDRGLVFRQGAVGWAGLGGTLVAPPAVVDAGGAPVFFGVGTAHQLLVRSTGTGWTPAAPASTYCLGIAAAEVGGAVQVACEGHNHQLYAGVAAAPAGGGLPAVASWRPLGGTLSAAPAVTGVNGVVTYLVAGTGGTVYARTPTTGYQRQAWSCAGPVAAVVDGSGADAACRSAAGALSTVTITGTGWSAPVGRGGSVVGAPAVLVGADGPVYFVEGSDGALYTRTSTAGYTDLGGVLVGGVAAAPGG